MWGFLDFNQDIPTMICLHPRLTTMRSMSSESWESNMWIWTFQRIVPHQLAIPSTLNMWTSWGSFLRGKLVRDKSLRSIKFLVAPGSTGAVVLTICFPTSSLTGKHKVLYWQKLQIYMYIHGKCSKKATSRWLLSSKILVRGGNDRNLFFGFFIIYL